MVLLNTPWDKVPFPVEVPYVMRPHLRPWQPGEPILTTDSDFDRYQDEKIWCYDPVYGDNANSALVYEAAAALKSFDSSAPDIQGDAPVWQLTRALQEDFVIWAPNRAGALSAQILSVCLPSGWDPREKVNKTFLEIHEPVPDFDVVNRASDHIAKMITTKGPFIRHVWTISNRPGLNRRPDKCRPWSKETVDDMWFRCERQVTVPVNGHSALFLIRVYMQPLRDVMQDATKAQAIVDSIMSMTDATIDYKGFGYLRQYFLNRPIT
jgi:hypothetical protein